MRSTRLAGKVLAEIGGEPAIGLLLRRLQRARELSSILVATSEDPSDDALAAFVAERGVPVLRGPLEDVLARYRLAVQQLDCDAVVRITGDCPLIAPEIVDFVVRCWRETQEAYVANTLEPRTFPDGLDTEVVAVPALMEAAHEAREAYDREHVTPFIRDRPDRFSRAGVWLEPAYGDVRITLDTPDDLERLRELVDAVGPDAGLNDILAALGLPSARPLIGYVKAS